VIVRFAFQNMEDRNRNFRSYYYEKVGFRAVEEKKSLEILFKESPIDKKKLSHFTLRFTVPNTFRRAIYSVLLGKFGLAFNFAQFPHNL